MLLQKLTQSRPGLVGRMLRRLQVTGRSRDIKGAVALLSSEASDWLTGQNLVVDGGWSIW